MAELTPILPGCRGESRVHASLKIHSTFIALPYQMATLRGMKVTRTRIAAPVLALACLSLVGSIEVLNQQAGDAIARKRAQEPTSPWRVAAPRTLRIAAEKEYRHLHQLPEGQPLTEIQTDALDHLFQEKWKHPAHRIGRAMRFAIWGIPLGIATFFAGMASAEKNSKRILAFAASCCLVGLITFLITAVRYFPSLGW